MKHYSSTPDLLIHSSLSINYMIDNNKELSVHICSIEELTIMSRRYGLHDCEI